MAIPSPNLAGPRSEISHLDCNCCLKRSFSSGGLAMENISSTCTAKMTVPDVVRRTYTHHSHGTRVNPHSTPALWKVSFHLRLAWRMPYILFISRMTHVSLPTASKPGGCSMYVTSSSC